MTSETSTTAGLHSLSAAAVAAAGLVPENPKDRVEWEERMNFALNKAVNAAGQYEFGVLTAEEEQELAEWPDEGDKRTFVGTLLGIAHIRGYPRGKIGLATSFGEARNWSYEEALEYWKEHRTDPDASEFRKGSLDKVGIMEFNTPLLEKQEGIRVAEMCLAYAGQRVKVYKHLAIITLKKKDATPYRIREIVHIEKIGSVTPDQFTFETINVRKHRDNSDDFADDFDQDGFDDFDDSDEPEFSNHRDFVQQAMKEYGVSKEEAIEALKDQGVRKAEDATDRKMQSAWRELKKAS